MQFTKNVKLHSREHLLADDLSRMMGEGKRFAAYLGIAKRYHERDLRALARRVREKQDLPAEARGKYFFAALRDKPRRGEPRPRPKGRGRRQGFFGKESAPPTQSIISPPSAPPLGAGLKEANSDKKRRRRKKITKKRHAKKSRIEVI